MTPPPLSRRAFLGTGLSVVGGIAAATLLPSTAFAAQDETKYFPLVLSPWLYANADPQRAVRTLSGGNQQKAVLARWLLRGCRVLLLDEPTRGVDVGARSELYALVRELADSGVAVLFVSSEVPEVLGLADRALVLREGRIVHEAAAASLKESHVLDLVMEESAHE